MIVESLMLASIASAYLVVGVLIAGRRHRGYSHIRRTISELGEVGTDHTWVVSLGVFVPVGVCLGITAWLLHASHPSVAALAGSIAVGYLVGGVFPCDAGSPAVGSLRQLIHNLGGAAEYMGGAVSLMWTAEDAGAGFRVAGFVVAISAITLLFENPVRGLIQRIAEVCLFGGLLAALWMA